jgi:hypothetical protein
MKILISPKCKRAEERVRQHGNVMTLRREGIMSGLPAILVDSLNDTGFGPKGTKTKWTGWFTNQEVHWTKL